MTKQKSAERSNHEKSKTSEKRTSVNYSRWLARILKLSMTVLAVVYLIIPIIIRLNPWIMTEAVFLNHIRWPPFINLSNPEELGLNSAKHFFHPVNEGVELGVWHLPPKSFWSEAPQERDFKSLLSKGKAIFLYMHGNAGTRGGWHRIQLYKLFSSWDIHVIAFDYRGYADSSGSPTEDGVCEDVTSLYNWIVKHSADVPVYFWGHSLGSAIATKTAKSLSEKALKLSGLILEAPFNNLQEVAFYHPFSKPFAMGPLFSWSFIESMQHENISFATDENIRTVTFPTLILHAEDDGIVPYELGYKLYETAQAHQLRVQFQRFDGDHGYGHKHIHKSPDLPDIIGDFLKNCTAGQNKVDENKV